MARPAERAYSVVYKYAAVLPELGVRPARERRYVGRGRCDCEPTIFLAVALRTALVAF